MHDKSDAGDTSSDTKQDYCSVSLLKSLTWAEVVSRQSLNINFALML